MSSSKRQTCLTTDEITKIASQTIAVSDARCTPEYIMNGHKQQKKQPTAKDNVEILLRFKIRVFLFSSIDVPVAGATLLFPRFDFVILKIL